MIYNIFLCLTRNYILHYMARDFYYLRRINIKNWGGIPNKERGEILDGEISIKG